MEIYSNKNSYDPNLYTAEPWTKGVIKYTYTFNVNEQKTFTWFVRKV